MQVSPAMARRHAPWREARPRLGLAAARLREVVRVLSSPVMLVGIYRHDHFHLFHVAGNDPLEKFILDRVVAPSRPGHRGK
ncbi:MAG: hypothetical protein LBD64_08045 [Odoribacteraceae bacterium]|nr:hypothetical protein [Odoribacteraceae bacterium]